MPYASHPLRGANANLAVHDNHKATAPLLDILRQEKRLDTLKEGAFLPGLCRRRWRSPWWVPGSNCRMSEK